MVMVVGLVSEDDTKAKIELVEQSLVYAQL
jgi:hypothetical protein